jgi:hypothetical protein
LLPELILTVRAVHTPDMQLPERGLRAAARTPSARSMREVGKEASMMLAEAYVALGTALVLCGTMMKLIG